MTQTDVREIVKTCSASLSLAYLLAAQKDAGAVAGLVATDIEHAARDPNTPKLFTERCHERCIAILRGDGETEAD